MTNIETLQTQVDQVAKDLADLKKLTDETLKQTKTEAAAEKVKTAKEEINKKIEALKGLTDATSKADLAKLEAMLVTLEDSDKALDILKAEINPSAEIPENGETVDNTADFESITTGIAEMKTLVAELQTLIDEYKANKKTYTETEKTAKEKVIEEKKAAIEVKRKEIQAIIDKIRKGWTDLKIEDITDKDIKTALEAQKKKEEALLTEDETSLKAIETPTTTFREKVKNGASKTREKVKE